MNIDKKLYTLKYSPDTESHLKPDKEKCKTCKTRNCTYICPAKVYEWNDENQELIIKLFSKISLFTNLNWSSS